MRYIIELKVKYKSVNFILFYCFFFVFFICKRTNKFARVSLERNKKYLIKRTNKFSRVPLFFHCDAIYLSYNSQKVKPSKSLSYNIYFFCFILISSSLLPKFNGFITTILLLFLFSPFTGVPKEKRKGTKKENKETESQERNCETLIGLKWLVFFYFESC